MGPLIPPLPGAAGQGVGISWVGLSGEDGQHVSARELNANHGVTWEWDGKNKVEGGCRGKEGIHVPTHTNPSFYLHQEIFPVSNKLRALGGLQLPVCTTIALCVSWEL